MKSVEDVTVAPNLTQLEIPVLPETFNLTDGHVHQPRSPAQKRIIASMASIFLSSDREKQEEIEYEYLETFSKASGQCLLHNHTSSYFCSSASMAIEIIGNILRRRGTHVGLIQPCFDNLADILRRHDLPLSPVDEWCFGDVSSVEEIPKTVDAVMLVAPNNPTGFSISSENFEALVRACSQRGTILILDSSFRFYDASYCSWDQYTILRRYKVPFFTIEDTGKTWPTSELKVGLLTCSEDLARETYRVYSDFTLHLSPFVIKLCQKFIHNAKKDGFGHEELIIQRNRQQLEVALSNSVLQIVSENYMSVAWVKLNGGLEAQEVTRELRKEKVYVLPGMPFYWAQPTAGSGFVRIALARAPDVFRMASERIASVVEARWRI